MRDRKAMNIKTFLIWYNAIQVVASTYVFVQVRWVIFGNIILFLIGIMHFKLETANDHEVKFPEIEIAIFPEIKIMNMRSKFIFFMRFDINAFLSFNIMIDLLAASAIMRPKLFKFIKLHLWLIFSPNY